jgi:hypothetical protein
VNLSGKTWKNESRTFSYVNDHHGQKQGPAFVLLSVKGAVALGRFEADRTQDDDN